MGEVGDAHEEADCVQDVALARPCWLGWKVMTGAEYVLLCLPVESCDGVEGRVEAVNLNPLAVGLEALDHHGLDKHRGSYQVPPAGSSARNKIGLIQRTSMDNKNFTSFLS